MRTLLSIFLILVSAPIAAIAEVADSDQYLSELSKAMTVKWPKNKTLNIVCHGHSVPSGYFNTPIVDTFNAYPHLLHRALKEQNPHAVVNVIVTAIGGENAISGAKRFDAEVLTHKPDLLLIDYSLNDRRAGLEKSRAAWEEMITKAKQLDIEVLLLTPTPDKRADINDPEDPLNLHAEQVKKLAAKHGVGLVDSYAAFKKHLKSGGELDEMMSQVNHPNRKGHELVLAELLKWFPKP